MLNWISRHTSKKRNAHEIYGSIVTMTRMPGLYSGIGVADNLEKRFELLILHMFVVLNWLNGLEGENEKLKQVLVDRFFEDAEAITRQAGVGDLAVPKKMHRLAALFAARMKAYQEAEQQKGQKALESLIVENFFDEDPDQAKKSVALARFTRNIQDRLASRSLEWGMANFENIAREETAAHE